MNDLVLANRAADWRRLKSLVLDSVSSPITRRVYNLALDEFIECFGREPRPGFTKATVNAWRGALEARGLGAVSINVRITAVRKLAVEAADNARPLWIAGVWSSCGMRALPGRRLPKPLACPLLQIRTAYTQAGALRKTCGQETVRTYGKQTAAGV
jgi:hypothetical protein